MKRDIYDISSPEKKLGFLRQLIINSIGDKKATQNLETNQRLFYMELFHFFYVKDNPIDLMDVRLIYSRYLVKKTLDDKEMKFIGFIYFDGEYKEIDTVAVYDQMNIEDWRNVVIDEEILENMYKIVYKNVPTTFLLSALNFLELAVHSEKMNSLREEYLEKFKKDFERLNKEIQQNKQKQQQQIFEQEQKVSERQRLFWEQQKFIKEQRKEEELRRLVQEQQRERQRKDDEDEQVNIKNASEERYKRQLEIEYNQDRLENDVILGKKSLIIYRNLPRNERDLRQQKEELVTQWLKTKELCKKERESGNEWLKLYKEEKRLWALIDLIDLKIQATMRELYQDGGTLEYNIEGNEEYL